MGQAARAIIIENGQMLVMKRIKAGNTYYTLVGGKLNDGETPEQALVREVMEETGFQVVAASLVFTEKHLEPYNDQFIYLCEVAAHGEVKVQEESEEGRMNMLDMNVHTPEWINLQYFEKLPFSTMQLQKAIVEALKKGFPQQPIALS